MQNKHGEKTYAHIVEIVEICRIMIKNVEKTEKKQKIWENSALLIDKFNYFRL